ncbi:MAG: nucleotidyl transferase AbiEii/AbiGii toxin family protein [Firmicutes bacterium]|nr:nucleotidyl transferase AbiEii/AbiGii toxin family protein [Bacillota bacterium]
MADKAASLLAKLKNLSRQKAIPFQQTLNLYCQEEFIRRLSKSRFKDNLILKGGFLLYSFSGFETRPTVDADYLLRHHDNDEKSIKIMISEIFDIVTANEFIKFEIRSFEKINEIKEYNGIRINIMGIIGNTKTPFSIDLGVGDVVVPMPIERSISVMLEGIEIPRILTYSLESTIAEKFDAIVALGPLTSRMKDFYDIYYLALTFSFDGNELKNAILSTFNTRKRELTNESLELVKGLSENEKILAHWDKFCLSILQDKLDFSLVVNIIIGFLDHPVKAIIQGREFNKSWINDRRIYE